MIYSGHKGAPPIDGQPSRLAIRNSRLGIWRLFLFFVNIAQASPDQDPYADTRQYQRQYPDKRSGEKDFRRIFKKTNP